MLRLKPPRPAYNRLKISYQLEKTRELEIEEQIKKCTIFSPSDGEVTYANKTSGGSQDGVLIEEGKQVRERQRLSGYPTLPFYGLEQK